MLWSILLVKKNDNGWFINYIQDKLNLQISKLNLHNNIEVIIYEHGSKFYGDYINIIEENTDISDNYIEVIYNQLKSADKDCIVLKGLIFIDKYPYESYLPISKYNPIKKELIFNLKNILYYINSENLSPIVKTTSQLDSIVFFKEEKKLIKESISIIITAYQTQDYIEECLDSIENQSYFIDNDNFEVLVGVDGCQDTLNKLLSIQYKYRNLSIYMMKENKGTYITTNTLINLVKCENVIRFDSDDIMTPNLIREVIKDKKDNDIVVLGSFGYLNGKIDHKLLITEGIIYFKKSVMDNIIGGYQPWICSADTELIKRVINKVKVYQIKKALFYRRLHNNSLTQKKETKYNSEIRENYKKLIKKTYNDNEVKIERIVNEIVPNIQSINLESKKKYNLLLMISTYNRLDFLKKTVDTWFKTCDKSHNWTLIISDDGSIDGTLDYLKNLDLENIKIIILNHYRRGIHHQTNSMLKLASNLDFDFGFKLDDDLIFLRTGWDNLYINLANKYKYYHLIYYDKLWGSRRGEKIEQINKDNVLENCVNIENVQGALWTFNKDVIKNVGYFDTSVFNLCGLGHVDYSIRCCRMGYNDINTPFDIANSNYYIILNKEKYISHNNFKEKWNTPEILKNKKLNLLKNDRKYIPYNEYDKNLLNINVDKIDISFIVPLRGREDQIKGFEYNIQKYFSDYMYEIIYVIQNDEKLFKRGQLCNIGFNESKGSIIVFQDVDIRHLRHINFEKILNKYKKPFVAFDQITQLYENNIGNYEFIENEDRLYGFGACAVLTREQFIISGGFSNLIIGWGAEDNIMNERVGGYIRYKQNLGHVWHKPLRKDPKVFNSKWYKNNRKMLATDKNRNYHFDGYRYTNSDNIIKVNNNIKIIMASNIGVKNFKYNELYEECLKNDIDNK